MFQRTVGFNFFRALFFLTLFFFAVGCCLSAQAQFVNSSGGSQVIVSTESSRRLGLDRMWYTHVDMGAARGRVAGVYQHVSAAKTTTYFEILFERKSYLFSESDRDAFGAKLGIERARKKAEEKLADIKAEIALLEGANKPAEPVIETRVLPEITLYLTSELGTLHALDGETGKTKWVTTVGTSNVLTTAPTANDDYVAAVNGTTLYILKAADGTPVWSKRMSDSPGSGPVVTEEYVFVPMTKGLVEIYRFDLSKRPSGFYQSYGLLALPPVSNSRSVSWVTDRGFLYCASGTKGAMRFRVSMPNPIDASPCYLLPDKVVCCSLDGYVYCVSEKNGDIIWKFSTGQPSHQPPFALRDAVFVVTDSGNLVAINAVDGQEKWISTGVKRVLSASAERLYVQEKNGNLMILGAQTGSRLGNMPLPGLDLAYSNTTTDRILLGSKSGTLQMLREISSRWPVVHTNIEKPKRPEVVQKKDVMPAVDMGKKPAGDDPFGDPDPFGGGEPKKMEKPKAEDDPFK